MLELLGRRRGAISIFLIIVLVPMLIVSSIFVDMSRIRLAKAVATSAGDLTLNTALTDYDAVLKDMYGLFATSQNIDELLENLEDYYRKSIEATGVAAADADNYVDQIMSMLKSATGTDDLLNMNLTDFSLTKPTGASLANPAILKSQIIEFMKYRAPLHLGSGFLDALQSMKNLDKQTELVDDKNTFYEEQKTILEKLEAAWREIQTYQYSCASQGFPTGTYIATQSGLLNADANTLIDTLIPDTLKYLYYKEYFYSNGCSIDYTEGDEEESIFDDSWTFEWFGTTVSCTRAYGEDDSATTDNVLECLQEVFSSIKEVEKYISDSEYNELYQLISKVHDSDLGQIYAVYKFNKAGKSNYANAIKNLLLNLVNLQSAMECCSEEDMKEEKITVNYDDYTVELAQNGSTTLYSVAKSQIDAHLKTDGSYLAEFKGYTSKLDGYVAGLSSVLDTKAVNGNQKFDLLRDHAYNYYELINDRISNLTNAITHLNGVKSALSSSDSTYSQALSDWEASADNLSDDTMGKNDKKEIEELKKLLTADKVNSLITRLTNAKTTLENVRTQIAAYKFENVSWKDISDGAGYTKLIDMLTSGQKTSLEAIVPESNSAYDTVIAEVKNTVTTGTISTTWTDENSPDLTKAQRELYTWLYNNYYDPGMNYTNLTANEDKTASGDDELAASQKELKDEADKHTTSTPNSSTKVTTSIADYVEYLPSGEWGDLLTDIQSGTVETDPDALLNSSSQAVDNLLSQIMDLLENMATSLRDDMYISDYIMSMFSYDTFEAEITKENDGDLSEFSSWYEKDDDEYKVKSEYEKYAAEALTLTNNSINPNMNYLYGSEIEYIIYGGSDMDANKVKAYGTIFLLRFSFNTVYAFTDAEINNTAMAAATALFGTPPLTPLIPMAKIAMIIGISIAESAYDLFILKMGDSVPLMKNSDTWTMKPSSAVETAAGAVMDMAVDYVVDEGSKILNDVLSKTDEELQRMIDEGLLDISELAQSAANSTIITFKNYANEALQQAVDICNNVNQKLMYDENYISTDGAMFDMGSSNEKVQMVIAELNTWLNNQENNSGDAVYEVKAEAVKYLISDNGVAISSIFDAIKDSTVEKTMEALDDVLTDIRLEISDKIDELSSVAGTKLHELEKELINSLSGAVDEGAEKVRAELKKHVSETFGTSSEVSSGTTTIVSTILSWSYSDYLTLFLLISAVTNEEAVLLRTTDIIELNMQHMNGEYASITTTETQTVSRFWGLWKTTKEVTTTEANQKAFKLSKSYTYLSISASIEVKPLLMTLPLMEDTTRSQLTGTNWYEIHYKGTLGY